MSTINIIIFKGVNNRWPTWKPFAGPSCISYDTVVDVDVVIIHFKHKELSYDHFSGADGSIYQILKMEKIGFKVMATI